MAGENRLLGLLADAERREVFRVARRRSFSKGEVLFHEGDPGDALVLVDRGHVGIRGTTPGGDTLTFAIVGPGDFLGEQVILGDDARRTASGVALDDVIAHYLSVDDFEALVDRWPGLWRVIAHSTAGHVRRSSAHLLEALYLPADARTLRRLHELSSMFDDGGTEVVVPLTQQDIAGLAGTTRPTANRVLKSLETDGVVRLGRGRVVVVDLVELERRAR